MPTSATKQRNAPPPMAHGSTEISKACGSARDSGVYKRASLLSNLLFHIILIVAKIFCLPTSSPSVVDAAPAAWSWFAILTVEKVQSYWQYQHQQDEHRGPNINSFPQIHLLVLTSSWAAFFMSWVAADSEIKYRRLFSPKAVTTLDKAVDEPFKTNLNLDRRYFRPSVPASNTLNRDHVKWQNDCWGWKRGHC